MPILILKKSGKSWTFFFRIVKTLNFIAKTNIFEGLASCVRERYKYQKYIKDSENDSNIDGKSMLNVGMKNDAKVIEQKSQTGSSNGSNSMKKNKKYPK